MFHFNSLLEKTSKANAWVSKSLAYACAVAYLGGWSPLPASSLPCADWVSHSRWGFFSDWDWFCFSAHEMTPSALFRCQDCEFIIMGLIQKKTKQNYFLILIPPFRKNTFYSSISISKNNKLRKRRSFKLTRTCQSLWRHTFYIRCSLVCTWRRWGCSPEEPWSTGEEGTMENFQNKETWVLNLLLK